MEWLVYSIDLAIAFDRKPTKSLLPPYYVVPQVLDSIRYRLVHEIGLFRFSLPLYFTQNQPHDSSDHIMLFPKFWTQSDIDWSMKSDYSVFAIGFHSKPTKRLLPPYYVVPQFLPLDFTQNQPKDSSRHIMLFPKFWTQSDIDWSMKSDYSGS
ncbi:unnamed protein product [Prunus armeniaca]